MRATIKQAETNERNLVIKFAGYGQYTLSIEYYGKVISCHSTNSIAVDDYNSNEGEKKDGCNRIKTGYVSLCNEVIRKCKI